MCNVKRFICQLTIIKLYYNFLEDEEDTNAFLQNKKENDKDNFFNIEFRKAQIPRPYKQNYSFHMPISNDYLYWKIQSLNQFSSHHQFSFIFSNLELLQLSSVSSDKDQLNLQDVSTSYYASKSFENLTEAGNFPQIKLSKIFMREGKLQIEQFYSPAIFDKLIHFIRNYSLIYFKQLDTHVSICQYLGYTDKSKEKQYFHSQLKYRIKELMKSLVVSKSESDKEYILDFYHKFQKVYHKQINTKFEIFSRIFDFKYSKDKITIDFQKVDHCKFTLKLSLPDNRNIAVVEGYELGTNDDSVIQFALVRLHDSFEMLGPSGPLYFKTFQRVKLTELLKMFFTNGLYDFIAKSNPTIEISLDFYQNVQEAQMTVMTKNNSQNQNYTKKPDATQTIMNILLNREDLMEYEITFELFIGITYFHSNFTNMVTIAFKNIPDIFIRQEWIRLEILTENGIDVLKRSKLKDPQDRLEQINEAKLDEIFNDGFN